MCIYRYKGVFFNNIYDGIPPKGISEAQRAESFFKFYVTDPPRGRPVGGGGTHHA
jgi:hypothetical protein